jgi:protein SEY1
LSTGKYPPLDIPPPQDYTEKSFFTLLTPTKQADLTTRFKRAADTVYLEAKNSTVSSISRVPAWFYVLLLVLGWNELMALWRNPILFVLFIAMIGGGYLAVQAGLLVPMMKVGNAMVEQMIELARVSISYPEGFLIVGIFEEFCVSTRECFESTGNEARFFRGRDNCHG